MFKLKLSPELQEQIDTRRRELNRLYSLTDEWLAHALLKLARQAQASSPRCVPEEPTYSSSLVWGIVPELSRRLGTVKLTVREIDWEVRELTDYELRCHIGHTLGNINEHTLPGWGLLCGEAINGNPVVFGIDRLCPGKLGDREDRTTCRVAETARHRGVPYNGVWTPAVMDY